MKITKKRIAIATAAAALATVGIFGGTYAKYNTSTAVNTEEARLAKFYLVSDNTINLFKSEYTNTVGTGVDVKNGTGDGQNLIAPNVTTTKDLDFTVDTEVKSELTFSGFTVDTNLPAALHDYIFITIENGAGSVTYSLANLVANPNLGADVVVPAGTVAGQYTMPVTFEWDLDNNAAEDVAETTAAILQALGTAPNGGYFLNLTGNATLTQID